MIDELELLRRHVDTTVDPDPDLQSVRRRVVHAIASDAAATGRGPRRDRRGSRPARRAVLSVGSLAAAGVVASVVVLLVITAPPVPRGTGPRPTAAFPSHLPVGDQLRLIADRVSDQPLPRIGNGQLLFTQAQLSVFASVNNGAAQTTIELSVQKWSTGGGQTCTLLSAQPAQFASPSEQAAWSALGLLDSPQPPTASECLEGGGGSSPDAITGAGQLIDVSALPTDPTALAQQLQAGTTGIPALDQLLPDGAAPNMAFQRATLLLIGPTVGATPQFDSALYQAIARLPAVIALGPMVTHDGQAGQGFASGPGTDQTTIVVDPATGRLLEVRGLDDANTLTALAPHYLAGGPMKVDAYSAQLQWLDPVGTASVVGLSSLPAGLPLYVFATVEPGVNQGQLDAFSQQLFRQYSGVLRSSDVNAAGPTDPTVIASFDWSFASSTSGPVVDQFMQALRASGFFAAVTEI
jgi:hypothetical protein